MTKKVSVGNVVIGGGSKISIQSMCNTPTKDFSSTIQQIKKCEKAGCEIVRVAVPDMESAKALEKIKKEISIPLVADIHFDHRLAIESAKHVDKLRINPGNIGSNENIKKVVESAKHYSIPIRIGVNLGSLDKDIEEKFGRTPEAMVESASKNIKLLEQEDFYDIVVSLKASDIKNTVEANRLFAKKFDYPLHLGITESGTLQSGSIKSAIGLGILLYEGIGDTIRISLSSDPVQEIVVAKKILSYLNLKKMLSVTSCPRCARTSFDVEYYAEMIEKELGDIEYEIKVAVMGCSVNGPGEAKNSDIAIIGNNNKDPLLYIKGKYSRIIKEDEIISTIRKEVSKDINKKKENNKTE